MFIEPGTVLELRLEQQRRKGVYNLEGRDKYMEQISGQDTFT